MPELPDLVGPLLQRPVLPRPPVEHVAALARRRGVRLRKRAGLLLAGLALLLSSVEYVAGQSSDSVNVASSSQSDDSAMAADPGASSGPGTANGTSDGPGRAATGPRGKAPDRPPASTAPRCEPGANGGATDVGVTATGISIAMPLTLDGPDAPAASAARRAVLQEVEAVNQAGGVCGRRLSVTARNGWFDPPPGTFAMLVGPLRPGLDDYIASGRAAQAQVPVIGTDGLDDVQFTSPLVWPVGTPTAALVRLAAGQAYRAGARTFALVGGQAPYDRAERVLRASVAGLPGASVRYAGHDAAAYNAACVNDGCDAVIWAMSDSAAADWVRLGPSPSRVVTAALPLAATGSVAAACGQASAARACEHLIVWDPYAVDHAADPLAEGGVVGVRVLVEAMRMVGPNLTRAALRQALDGGVFATGITDALDWGPNVPAGRVGNAAARGLMLRDGQFIDAGTGWVRDPTPGVFP